MTQLICPIAFVPIRKEPTHRSEQVSQLLFGEKATLLNKVNDWYKISTDYDKYEGWIESEIIHPYEETEARDWTLLSQPSTVIINKEWKLHLSVGSEIPIPDESNQFFIHNTNYKLTDPLSKLNSNSCELALQFLYTPYLWGGRTIFGVDCSGLVQIVHKILGVFLPRDASDQVNEGNKISSLTEVHPGDLAFFNNPEGKICHVGIIMQNQEIIHASKYVRIDRIDEKGIFNREIKKYTHKLHCIKRLC